MAQGVFGADPYAESPSFPTTRWITPPKAPGRQTAGVAMYRQTTGGASAQDVYQAQLQDYQRQMQALAQERSQWEQGLSGMQAQKAATGQEMRGAAAQSAQQGIAGVQPVVQANLADIAQSRAAAQALGPAAVERGQTMLGEQMGLRQEALTAFGQQRTEALEARGMQAKDTIQQQAESVRMNLRDRERELMTAMSSAGASQSDIRREMTKLRMQADSDVGRMATQVSESYNQANANLRLQYDATMSQVRSIQDQLMQQTQTEALRAAGISEATGVEQMQMADQLAMSTRQWGAEQERVINSERDQMLLALNRLEIGQSNDIASFLAQMPVSFLPFAPLVAELAQWTSDMKGVESASLAAVQSAAGGPQVPSSQQLMGGWKRPGGAGTPVAEAERVPSTTRQAIGAIGQDWQKIAGQQQPTWMS